MTFTLHVTAVVSDTTASDTVTTTASAAYMSTLASPDSLGTVTFTATSANGVSIDSSGNVTTGSSLNAGDHVVTAAWSDTNGDSGTVTFTLHVTAVVSDATASDTSPPRPRPPTCRPWPRPTASAR